MYCDIFSDHRQTRAKTPDRFDMLRNGFATIRCMIITVRFGMPVLGGVRGGMQRLACLSRHFLEAFRPERGDANTHSGVCGKAARISPCRFKL